MNSSCNDYSGIILGWTLGLGTSLFMWICRTVVQSYRAKPKPNIRINRADIFHIDVTDFHVALLDLEIMDKSALTQSYRAFKLISNGYEIDPFSYTVQRSNAAYILDIRDPKLPHSHKIGEDRFLILDHLEMDINRYHERFFSVITLSPKIPLVVYLLFPLNDVADINSAELRFEHFDGKSFREKTPEFRRKQINFIRQYARS